jgi:hypothetical protein
MSDPLIEFDILDQAQQEFQVRAEGPDVLIMEENAAGGDADPDDITPDWAAVFVQAVNAGMLGGVSHAPWTSSASITACECSPEAQIQNWRVASRGLDRGAFLVLLNMLRARNLDRIILKTFRDDADARRRPRLSRSELTYPAPYEALPFRLDIEPPLRRSKDRSIQIMFAHEPHKDVYESCYAAFQLWITVLLLGGYPREDMHPRRSGVFPEVAYRLDRFTIEQNFPEIFDCAEESFYAMVNWACAAHRSQCPVETVRIR